MHITGRTLRIHGRPAAHFTTVEAAQIALANLDHWDDPHYAPTHFPNVADYLTYVRVRTLLRAGATQSA